MSSALFGFTVCVLVLFVKMFAISCYQGVYRISRMTFKNAEDARLVGRPASAQELAQVTRAAQAWQNDVENIPLFFILGTLYVLLQAPATTGVWLFASFTAARVVHTVCYLAQWQPWRTLAYAVGIVCLFAMAGLILSALVDQAG